MELLSAGLRFVLNEAELVSLGLCLLVSHTLLLRGSISCILYYYVVALLRSCVFLALALLLEFLIGVAVVKGVIALPELPLLRPVVPGLSLAGRIGAGAAVGITLAFLRARVPLRMLKEQDMKERGAFAAVTLNLLIKRSFNRAVAKAQRDDEQAFFNAEGFWGRPEGLTEITFRRRIRVLYEKAKKTLAREARDPGLLRRDTNTWHFEKFLPLVNHHGRWKLRRLMFNPVEPPSPAWDGRERRVREGTPAHRENDTPETAGKIRCYDDEAYVRAIKDGRA